MYTSLVDTKGVYMKEDLWMSIRSDRLKGLSYVSIAKKYSLDRRTVKKYCLSETKPKYNTENIKVGNFYITGIDGEVDKFYKGDYDVYFAQFKNALQTMPLDEQDLAAPD